ncbi:MAG: HAMP domain-containing sensor histidine kinase [Roseovarius confluentis]|uniref:HAMP domain-containing sensor histidine kinase n=1 Tax=Roseovarius sp. TaxID=1486281 RepID=UPI0032EBDD31
MAEKDIRDYHLLLAQEITQGLRHSMRAELETLRLLLFALERVNAKGDLTQRQQHESQEIIDTMMASLRSLGESVDETERFYRSYGDSISKIDLYNIVSSAVNDYSKRLADQDVSIKITGDKEASTLGSPDQLRIAFQNIILNSLQAYKAIARRSRRKIDISIYSEKSDVSIVFSDNAGGIPKEHENTSLEVGYTTKKGSTGLGLAVVRHVIEQHQGQLILENRYGDGFTVRIRLPRRISERSDV